MTCLTLKDSFQVEQSQSVIFSNINKQVKSFYFNVFKVLQHLFISITDKEGRDMGKTGFRVKIKK